VTSFLFVIGSSHVFLGGFRNYRRRPAIFGYRQGKRRKDDAMDIVSSEPPAELFLPSGPEVLRSVRRTS